MFATLYASLAAHFKGIQIFDDISQNGNHYNSGLASWLELGQKLPNHPPSQYITNGLANNDEILKFQNDHLVFDWSRNSIE